VINPKTPCQKFDSLQVFDKQEQEEKEYVVETQNSDDNNAHYFFEVPLNSGFFHLKWGLSDF
jgi:hypothetical protein